MTLADVGLIRTIEEISTNALPCLETIYYDGWVLRFANAYPRRANSVHPFYDSTLPLEQKIDFCQQHYWSRGWRTVFKITPASAADLAPRLQARSYELDAHVSLQVTQDLKPLLTPERPDVEVENFPAITREWLAEKKRLNGFTEPQAGSYGAILAKIPLPAAFIRLKTGGKTAALALGVVDRGWVGVYSLITDETMRGQGLATLLINKLFAWARAEGASRAYLQVAEDNAPALRLYQRFGFSPVYSYWYLQKDPPGNES